MPAFDPNWQCYQITTRPIGEDSDREITHAKDYLGEFYINDEKQFDLFTRHRAYHNKYHREFQFSIPVMERLDGSVNEGDTAGSEYETTGEISEDFSFMDTQFIYLDLQNDIFVYRKTEGDLQFADSGDEPIGQCLIDDGNGLQTHTTMDTVGITANHNLHSKRAEKIVVKTPAKDIELYVTESTVPVEMNLGSTDYSGNCGGLSYICLKWGTYGIVNETKPHPNKDDYVPLYETDMGSHLAEYLPPWIADIPTFRDMDNADANRFDALLGTTGSGTEAIALPVPNDPFPQGSWAVDKKGNMFFSQLHTGGVYNVLIKADGTETDPVTVVDMAGENPVYYPIAAV